MAALVGLKSVAVPVSVWPMETLLAESWRPTLISRPSRTSLSPQPLEPPLPLPVPLEFFDELPPEVPALDAPPVEA
jgi:hypothetical protein